MTSTRTNRLFRPAAILLMVLFCLTIVFHLLILTGIIDYRFVWGGRLHSVQEMRVFECVSLVLNGLFLWVTLQQTELVKVLFPRWLLKTLLVLMAVVFGLNTIGNLLAKETAEQLIFTPLTLISCVGSLILLFGKKRA